jgi:hypothetical protein
MCKPHKMNGAKASMTRRRPEIPWSRLEEEWAKDVMARMVE